MTGSPENRLYCHSQRPTAVDGRFVCANTNVTAPSHLVWDAICRLCSQSESSLPESFRDFPDTDRIVERGQVQLVVARYKEDLAWLDPFSGFDVLVYDKSGEAAENPLPNIGREAHTYLHHIITHYDDLAETIVFLQGDPHFHCRDLYEKVHAVHRGTEYVPLSETLIVEQADGTPTHPGLSLDSMYERLLSGSGPLYYVTHSAACFAVSRERIRARPKSFYEKMLQAILDDPNGPWQAERLWPHIFASPEATSAGIVTAADSHIFEDLQFLLRSLEHTNEYPIALYDLGLTTPQRKWVESQPNVRVLALPAFGEPLNRARRLHWWQTWIKPLLIFQAPFDQVLWLDADCFVLGDVGPVLEAIEQGPVFVMDITEAETENLEGLADILGAPDGDSEGTVNAGVVGVDKKRDYELLCAWAYGVDWVTRNQNYQSLVAWADQGILLWAIRRLGLSDRIRRTTEWNHPSGEQDDLIAGCLGASHDLSAELQQRFPGTLILHWLGVHKLSKQLRDQIESLMFRGPLSLPSTTPIP